jgi:hypothetical protein
MMTRQIIDPTRMRTLFVEIYGLFTPGGYQPAYHPEQRKVSLDPLVFRQTSAWNSASVNEPLVPFFLDGPTLGHV